MCESENTKENIIISFTSYPKRINSVKTVLDNMYAQTMQADKILLYLASLQFPNLEQDLPPELQQDLQEKRFEVKWCDDLGTHKKYFYAMQEYPQDIIITIDDDSKYENTFIQTLYELHLKFPKAVCAPSVFLLQFSGETLLPPSKYLHFYRQLEETPSMQLYAIGHGGILYPPKYANETLFNKDIILTSCKVKEYICENDAYLKMYEVLNSIPVVSTGKIIHKKIPGTQEVGIHQQPNMQAPSDQAFLKILEHFNSISEGELQNKLRRMSKTSIGTKGPEYETYLINLPKTYLRMFLTEEYIESPTRLNPNIEQKLVNLIDSTIRTFNLLGKNKIPDEIYLSYKDLISKYKFIEELKKDHFQVKAFLDYYAILPTHLWGKYETKKAIVHACLSWLDFIVLNPLKFKEYKSSLKRFTTYFIRYVKSKFKKA